MDVSVTIVSYNTAHCIEKCLQSVLNQTDVDFEIIVVDNSSEDESVELLKTYPDIHLIINSENIGFGAGHKKAFACCKGRYVLILNPDAFLGEGFLQTMTAYMDENPNIGISGSKITYGRGKIDLQPKSDYPAQERAGVDFSHLPGTIAWLPGACLFVRSSAFEQIGGFRENYFLFGEEIDLCLRIRQAGFSLGFNSDATVGHLGGESYRHADYDNAMMHKSKSLIQFWSLHYPAKSIRRLVWSLFLISTIRCCGYRIWNLIPEKEETGNFNQPYYAAARQVSRDWLKESRESYLADALCMMRSMGDIIFKTLIKRIVSIS